MASLPSYRHFALTVVVLCVPLVSHQGAHGGWLWGGDYSGTVSRIDPDTGDETPVFQFPFEGDVPWTINGLAFDPGNNRMVGVTGGDLFDDPIVLFQFNPHSTNPVPAVIGTYEPVTSAQYVTGLAFDDSGFLYLSEKNALDDQLVQFDLDNMSVVNVYDLPAPANYNTNGLDSGRSPGEILAIHGSDELVFSIDVPGGPTATIGSFSQVGFTNAIAFDPENGRFFMSDTRLIEFDPYASGVMRVVSDASYNGLAYAPVPEPSGLLLVLAAMLAIISKYLPGGRDRSR